MSARPTKSPLAFDAGGNGPDDVRRRGDHVDAGGRGQLGVRRAGRSVCTSDPARLKYSELVSRWKNFGTVFVRSARASRPSIDAGFRIGLRTVGEREHVHRIQDVEVLQLIARLLAEAVIERPAAGAAHLIEHAVEHLAALLVFVEALVDEVAQEPAGLRHAPADSDAECRARDCPRVVSCLKKLTRSRVPARPQPTTRGSWRAIDDVVDAAGLEAAVERDGAGRRRTATRVAGSTCPLASAASRTVMTLLGGSSDRRPGRPGARDRRPTPSSRSRSG